MKIKYVILLITALFIGLFFRLWNINFGLPHSFYADEPEIVELAMKYTYEFRNIIGEGNFYKLVPISYVYGAFPSYINTLANMAFSKSMNLLGMSFDRYHVYTFLRIMNAIGSSILIFSTGYLAYKIFKDKKAGIIASFLIALNWKLIVHAHYSNADIIQTVLLSLSFITLFHYFKRFTDTKYTLLSGILFGLAIGTKITTLIAIPLYLYIFLVKRDYKGLGAFVLIALGSFIISNPFSLIFSDNFFFRIMEMFTKEAGMVFDSVDPNIFKYVSALIFISTPIVFFTSLYGKLLTIKDRENNYKEFHYFLFLNVVIYLIFFSLQSRRVDRWLLPLIPIITIYSSYGISDLLTKINRRFLKVIFISLIVACVTHYPIILLNQFRRHTPKSAAYVWLRDNIQKQETVLGYTEEGIDPMKKIDLAEIEKIIVYTDEAAHLFMPKNPEFYNYIVLASRPMQYHKKDEVSKAYPLYHERWQEFEKTLMNESKFELVKEFVLPKPNLIPLSDVFIYKRL